MTNFEQLYRAYFQDVYRYILRLSGDGNIAEEITSDTFFKAMDALDTFREDCDVRAWLCQIAKNSYYTYLKKRSRTDSMEDALLQNTVDPTPAVAEAYERKEEIGNIMEALHTLREPYKEVFMWRIFAQLSFRQIGQIFGKTENWACVTYHRAGKMLRQIWEDKIS